MNLNKIYHVVNEFLDSYLMAGITAEDMLTYLNTDEDNYKFVYNKIYRTLNLQNVQFESAMLTECLQDSIRDKVAMLNDLENKNNKQTT